MSTNALKNYLITIVEGVESHVQVQASGPEDAKDIALEKYKNKQTKVIPLRPVIADLEQVG